jgi:hypothetical protein
MNCNKSTVDAALTADAFVRVPIRLENTPPQSANQEKPKHFFMSMGVSLTRLEIKTSTCLVVLRDGLNPLMLQILQRRTHSNLISLAFAINGLDFTLQHGDTVQQPAPQNIYLPHFSIKRNEKIVK